MRLTKLQRHTAYIIMDHEARTTMALGFCSLIDRVFDIKIDNDQRFGNLRKFFPELWGKRKYPVTDVFLFDNWNQRREALKQCIIETY